MPTITFILIAVMMVITPGPNMAYLVSRSISQGRMAGMISLGGVVLGFVAYVLCASLGLTAVLLAVPYAYDALRIAGAAYLFYLAVQALRPGGRSPFQVHALPRDSRAKLFSMGLLTSLLNPKIAMFYLSVIPQFVEPEKGYVLLQSLALGGTQIAVSLIGNTIFVFAAGSIAGFLAARPAWALVQRWFMGLALGGFAVRMALDSRR
jgi:threonine/homoserine/homoserine lactone efflux protein